MHKYLLIFFICFVSEVFGAAFTLTQTGNFNDGATWGNTSPGVAGVDYPDPAGGDTFLLNNGSIATITSGYTTITSGVIDNGTLTVDGTLTLDADIDFIDNNSVLNGTSGTINLGNFNFDVGGQYWKTCTISISGTSSDRFLINSTGGGIGAGYYWHCSFYMSFVTFDGLTRFSTYRNADVVVEDCIFTNFNGVFAPSSASESINYDFIFRRCIFDECIGTSGRIEFGDYGYKGLDGSGTGEKIVEECVFIDGSQVWLGAGIPYERNVFYLTTFYQHDATDGIEFDTNLFYQIDDDAIPNGNITYNNNYIYVEASNPHVISGANATSSNPAPMIVKNTIFEIHHNDSPSDASDVIILCKQDIVFQIHNNIHLEHTRGYLINALGSAPVLGDLYVYNNTYDGDHSNALNYPSLANTEGGGTYAGDNVEFYNNLSYNTDGTTTGVNLIDFGDVGTADQATYLDYNVCYDYLETIDIYHDAVITGKTFGDDGFGGNDAHGIDPGFVDPTRDMATWDAYNGGVGTAANAALEMAKLNDSDFDDNYTVAKLMEWVSAGFAPTNSAVSTLSNTGSYVGAIEPLISDGITGGSGFRGGGYRGNSYGNLRGYAGGGYAGN